MRATCGIVLFRGARGGGRASGADHVPAHGDYPLMGSRADAAAPSGACRGSGALGIRRRMPRAHAREARRGAALLRACASSRVPARVGAFRFSDSVSLPLVGGVSRDPRDPRSVGGLAAQFTQFESQDIRRRIASDVHGASALERRPRSRGRRIRRCHAGPGASRKGGPGTDTCLRGPDGALERCSRRWIRSALPGSTSTSRASRSEVAVDVPASDSAATRARAGPRAHRARALAGGGRDVGRVPRVRHQGPRRARRGGRRA
jgi:hypothetical protein